MKRDTRLCILAATLATLTLAACGSGEGEEVNVDSAEVSVVLAPSDIAVATSGEITSGVLVTGTLEPERQATLTAQVGGTINNLSVNRGSAVRAGQRIATIRAEGVQSQAAGAQANVAAAEAQLAVARTQRDGARRLFEAGAISRVDYENSLAQYRAAEAQLAAARAQAAAAGETAGFTSVTAPFTGVVSDRQVEPGEAVRAGDRIVTIVNTSTLELAGRIPVDQAGAVRVNQAVTFTLDAFPDRTFRGSVARKDPAADPATRQVGVYVRLPNPNGEITAGQYARGQVAGERVTNAVTIPVTAIQGSGTDVAVVVVENNRLVRRAITLGARDESAGRVAVTSGLSAGEQILVRPMPNAPVGQPVVISGERAPSAPAVTQPDSGRE